MEENELKTEEFPLEETAVPEIGSENPILDEEVAESKPKKNFFVRIFDFFKTHKKLTISLIALILVCIAAVSVINAIHSAQAKEIELAQIGKCYITNYDSEHNHRTYVYYFKEEGVYWLSISYSDAEKKKIDYILGSLIDDTPGNASVSIDLFGNISLFGSDIQLDDQNQIISSSQGAYPWTLISLEEGLALEKSSYRMYELGKSCTYALTGSSAFKDAITSSLEFVSNFSISTATDSDYIGAAKTLINGILKNPSTAVYNSESLMEKDSYGRGIVYLDVSAQNSFGGYVRSQYYVCIQSIRALDRFTYRTHCYYVDSSYSIESLKSTNDWNEDPNADVDPSAFLPDIGAEESTVQVSGYTLKQFVFKSQKITYVAYIEKDSNYILATELIIDKSVFENLDSNGMSMLEKALNSIVKCSGTNLPNLDYSEIFDTTNGVISEKPLFLNDGFLYQAKEEYGKIHFSCTNANALSLTETDNWSPVQ